MIYADLVYGNAAAWQWWLAISPYDYKDGLVYIDKNEEDGNYYDSKMLWVMGNYSRFIRPGMKRIKIDVNTDSLYTSGFADAAKHRLVLVFVNAVANDKAVEFSSNSIKPNKKIITYTTSATQSLEKHVVDADKLLIPAESIVTVVCE